MASNLHNLLAIRLRDDYAVSQLLNARFLDANYPEFGEDYHELLRDGNDVPMPPPVATPPVDEHESDADSEMFEFSDGEDYEVSQGWDYFRVAHSVLKELRTVFKQNLDESYRWHGCITTAAVWRSKLDESCVSYRRVGCNWYSVSMEDGGLDIAFIL
ncbi:hypothetical protein B0H14DRAFT_3502688 [Mycena olivaceomarginata]|nr:hypothetical protein B0H14DRAFT_3502688 [Mycena olivaceomarginata]